jgi:hypothetical protein
LNSVRAVCTTTGLFASSEKNHTPGSPPRFRTYVRRFTSWKLETNGSGGSQVARAPVTVNGTIPM